MRGEWKGKPAKACPGGFEKNKDDTIGAEIEQLRRTVEPFKQLVETVRQEISARLAACCYQCHFELQHQVHPRSVGLTLEIRELCMYAVLIARQAPHCMYTMLLALSRDESCTVEFTMVESEFKQLFKAQDIKPIEILGIRMYSGQTALACLVPLTTAPCDLWLFAFEVAALAGR